MDEPADRRDPGGKAGAARPSAALRGAVPGKVRAAKLPEAGDDLLLRIGDLYAEDAQLGPLWNQAQAARMKAGELGDAKGGAAAGQLAARLMGGADGARIAMIETNGWDTHNGQRGRLAAQLRGLDALVANLMAGLGKEWSNTWVIGDRIRATARANGTGGTDPAWGMAMLLGGAVAGGRIIADWPGLSRARSMKARPQADDRPDALIAAALSKHFALDGAADGWAAVPRDQAKAGVQRLIA